MKRGAAALFLLMATPSSAAPPCFDFSRPILEPLRPPDGLPHDANGGDVHVFGTKPGGLDWAAGRATLASPIDSVYQQILEHRSLKDMSKTTLSRTAEDRAGYRAFQFVDVSVRIRALLIKMKIEWREAWGFTVTEGTAEAPRRVVASYQKVSGSHHLEHLCGSYTMAALDGDRTELTFYEEVKASRRSAEDTRNMHMGILRNLRKP